MSKIAVSSQGPDLDDQVDPRFGRAAHLVVVDPETMTFESFDNSEARGMAQGAGIKAAETAAGSGAKVVLSGFVGPKAFQALSAAGIAVGQNVEGMSVRQAVEKYVAGQVEISAAPQGQMHGGGGGR